MTPQLYEEKSTGDLILKEDKAQQSTERGFRFIKAPLFFCFSVLSQEETYAQDAYSHSQIRAWLRNRSCNS